MIITRHLYREILSTILALLSILVLIYISHRLIRYLTEAASGGLPSEYIYQLLSLKLIGVLTVLVPLAFFLAILLTLGRLYVDNEMTVLSACGVGLPFILNRLMYLSVLIGTFVAICSFILSPWAEQKIEDIRLELRRMPEISGIAAGRFTSFHNGGTFYVESLSDDQRIMSDIFAAIEKPERSTVVTAKSGYQKADDEGMGRYLVLQQGQRYEGKAGGLDLHLTEFDEHRLLISPQPSQRELDLQAMDNEALWQQGDRAAMAELQMRLAIPLGILLLAPLAVLISHTTPRQGRYARLFVAMLIYFSYNNLLKIAQKWVIEGDMPVWLGLWWVHLILLISVLILWQKTLYGLPKWLLRYRKRKVGVTALAGSSS